MTEFAMVMPIVLLAFILVLELVRAACLTGVCQWAAYRACRMASVKAWDPENMGKLTWRAQAIRAGQAILEPGILGSAHPVVTLRMCPGMPRVIRAMARTSCRLLIPVWRVPPLVLRAWCSLPVEGAT